MIKDQYFSFAVMHLSQAVLQNMGVKRKEVTDMPVESNAAKMRDNRKDLEKALTDANASLDEYREFLDQLKELNEKMDEMYSYESERSSSYPYITKERKEELVTLYKKAGAKCEEFLTSKGSKNLPSVAEVVMNIAYLINKDSTALLDYEPEKGMLSLPSIVSQARMEHIDLGNRKLDTVGEVSSSRIPFSYRDEAGVLHEGLFTAMKEYDPTADFDALFARLDEKDEETKYGTMFKAFYKQALEKSNKKPAEEAHMARFAYKADKLSEKAVTAYVHEAYPELSAEKNHELHEAFNEWKTELKAYGKKYSLHVLNDGIAGKCRIDTRNAAMSRVAALLGVPDLLAHAKPMTVTYMGREIEGTFMEKSTGVDLEHTTNDCTSYTRNQLRGAGLKSMADLQVLDFICCNTDRHLKNMTYLFDTSNPDVKNRAFLGVQGIDNDNSFGYFTLQDDNRKYCFLTNADQMGVISRSMADAVIALKPEELKFQLRDMNLTYVQVHAAGMRLRRMQSVIERSQREYAHEMENNPRARNPHFRIPGLPRIISDEAFENMHIDDLAISEHGRENLFSRAENITLDLGNANMISELPMEKFSKDLGLFISSDERKNVTQHMTDMTKVTDEGRTSAEFENLRNAMGSYKRFLRRTSSMMMDTRTREERKELLEHVRDASIAYLEHKSRDSKFKAADVASAARKAKDVMHLDYAKNRISLAEKIGLWAEEQVNVMDKHPDPLREELDREALNRVHEKDDLETEKFNAMMKEKAKKIKEENDSQIHIGPMM